MASDNAFVGQLSMDSSWQGEKKHRSAHAQTVAVGFIETEAQTTVSALQPNETRDQGEGTDPRANVPNAKPAGSGWVYPGPHFEDEEVSTFISGIHESLLDELLANTKSSAFDRYEPNWKPRNDTLQLSSSLTPPFALEAEWHAIGLSWNATGSMVAVTYGRIDTVAWCHERGHACVWQLTEGDVTTPHVELEASSYITSISFHPRQPSVLAGGTYNGDVLLWNISDENPKPVSSTGFALGPREPVMKLQWLQNLREARESHRYVLCSASGDGRILFWSQTNKLQEALSGYEVQNRKRNVVGVQSMSFVSAGGAHVPGKVPVPGVENVMLLGLESGDVYRTKPGNSVAGGQQGASSLSVLDVDYFQGHLGPVHSIDCSPFFRHLFLTCSSDGSIRLYSTLERQHLMSVEPSLESKHYLYSAQFSPCRPAVFASVSRSSHLHIFDLLESRTSPVLTVEAGTDGSAAVSLAFCKTDPSLLATGDSKGTVRIWRMATRLCDVTDAERSAVRADAGPVDGDASPIRQLFGVTF